MNAPPWPRNDCWREWRGSGDREVPRVFLSARGAIRDHRRRCLLDEDYYAALKAAKKTVDGVTIIDEALLIPFKARAALDLTRRLEAGENIDRKKIRKHRNDVFRLVQLVPLDASFELPKPIHQDLQSFINQIQADESWTPTRLVCRSAGMRLSIFSARHMAGIGASAGLNGATDGYGRLTAGPCCRLAASWATHASSSTRPGATTRLRGRGPHRPTPGRQRTTFQPGL